MPAGKESTGMFHQGGAVTLSWPVSQLFAVEAVLFFQASRGGGGRHSTETPAGNCHGWRETPPPNSHCLPRGSCIRWLVGVGTQRPGYRAPIRDGSAGRSGSRTPLRTGLRCGYRAVQHLPLPSWCLRALLHKPPACESLAQNLFPWKLNLWYPLSPNNPLLTHWASWCLYTQVTLGKQLIQGPTTFSQHNGAAKGVLEQKNTSKFPLPLRIWEVELYFRASSLWKRGTEFIKWLKRIFRVEIWDNRHRQLT